MADIMVFDMRALVMRAVSRVSNQPETRGPRQAGSEEFLTLILKRKRKGVRKRERDELHNEIRRF